MTFKDKMAEMMGPMMASLVGEKFAESAEKIPDDWKPVCREARCMMQLGEWFLKRLDIENNKFLQSLNLGSLARAMAWKADTDPEKRAEAKAGLIDLYMLLDSYGFD